MFSPLLRWNLNFFKRTVIPFPALIQRCDCTIFFQQRCPEIPFHGRAVIPEIIQVPAGPLHELPVFAAVQRQMRVIIFYFRIQPGYIAVRDIRRIGDYHVPFFIFGFPLRPALIYKRASAGNAEPCGIFPRNGKRFRRNIHSGSFCQRTFLKQRQQDTS